AGPGRPARFCSTKCRVAAHREKGLPLAMTRSTRWLRWAEQPKAGGGMRKRPITVKGWPASSTKSSTWSTYAAAVASRAGKGLGFALGDGIGCIDLDHCLVDGELAPWAQAILDACPPTYIEVSPSGTGLHI